MEALALHIGSPTVHWEDNTRCTSVDGYRRVTPRVKHIDTPVRSLQDQFYIDVFIPKYDNSSVIPADMCIKPCSGPMTRQIIKWMSGFRLYQTIDTEHYQLMRLHKFVVN